MENSRPINYTFEDIKRYRQGLMTPEEMHAFEKASMEDPFLADALEGYMEADLPLAEQHLKTIEGHIRGAKDQKDTAMVVHLPKKGFAMWRVAAMVIVIAGAGLLTYKLVDRDPASPQGEIAQTTPKPATVPPAQVPQPATDTAAKDQQARGNEPSKSADSRTIARQDEADKINTAKDTKELDDQAGLAALNNRRAEEKERAALISDRQDKTAAPVRNEPAAVATYGNAPRTRDMNRAVPNEFRGTVLSPENQPLANANIRVDHTRQSIRTDTEGNFRLNANDTVVVATVASEGYMDTRVQLRSNTNNTINIGNIVLKPDPAFDHVAVTGIGVSKRERTADTLSTRPEGGWQSFQQYVSDQLDIPVDSTGAMASLKGELELEFYIDAKGLPRDFRVINSSDSTYNQKLIDAVRNGPRWTTRKKKTRLLVKFPGR